MSMQELQLDLAQHVTAEVTLDKLQLKVKWKDTATDGWPPYYIEMAYIKETSKKIRGCLQRIVSRGMEGEIQYYGDLLKELAGYGRKLYDGLFYQGGDGNEWDPLQIRDWLQNIPGPPLIKFIVDSQIHIPWGLIYDGNPKDLSDDPKADDINYFRNFWCLKFRLSSIYSKVTPVGMPKSADLFEILTVVNKSVFDNAVKSLSSEQDKIKQWIFQNYGEPIYTNDGLFDRWKQPDSEVGMLFFYCHANGTSLAIDADSDEPLTVAEFKHEMKRSAWERSRTPCLVFLNGCNTAVGDPDNRGESSGFLDATGGGGFCGFIGTEAKVPDLFALRFGLNFLYNFLYEGYPVYKAMAKLHEQHWPLSVTYSTYCFPFLYVIPGSLRSKSPLVVRLDEENFSRLHPLGTSTMDGELL